MVSCDKSQKLFDKFSNFTVHAPQRMNPTFMILYFFFFLHSEVDICVFCEMS